MRIGVHRGGVFAGNIGPSYRKTYTVMGDAVNLTARLMAKAEPGHAYATESILERSNTLFETTEIEPFAVKGKAEPVHAWSLGKAKGSRGRLVTLQRLALTGRNNELGVIRKILGGMRSGVGHLIEITGQPGVGKTRLLEATRDAAIGFRKLHNTCEAYTSSTPYAVWRDLLREMLEIPRDEPDSDVEARIRTHRRREGAGHRALAAAARCRLRAHARRDAGSRDARAGEPSRQVARGRDAVPGGRPARTCLRRDRERASHGRGVGRAARRARDGLALASLAVRHCASPRRLRF